MCYYTVVTTDSVTKNILFFKKDQNWHSWAEVVVYLIGLFNITTNRIGSLEVTFKHMYSTQYIQVLVTP